MYFFQQIHLFLSTENYRVVINVNKFCNKFFLGVRRNFCQRFFNQLARKSCNGSCALVYFLRFGGDKRGDLLRKSNLHSAGTGKADYFIQSAACIRASMSYQKIRYSSTVKPYSMETALYSVFPVRANP